MLSWFPNWSLRCLPRSVSDHYPILLGESKQDWGPIPFRFFNHWLKDNNMMKDAVEGWKRYSLKGAAGSSLAAKVIETKIRLKEWLSRSKKESFSLKHHEARLDDIDKKAAVLGWSESLRANRVVILSSEVWCGLRREEQVWGQKSRIKWLNEGDRNTRFFSLYC
ncbi:hypothetical protein Dsin_007298 [Dipteronia sinensis]|uniref:Reverse transcriptase n=1 Tax=Dipteronia sinensis TaxID=43782 RepID=A0AAE0EGF2_9ROSI|nr:hypothetical protein Dsin_007298 [Dipteronia sinensis]